MKFYRQSVFLVLITAIIFAGCVSTANYTAPSKRKQMRWKSGDGYVLESYVGVASFYGQEFAGKPTANGEIFDPSDLTAAHKEYPFDTILKVTNLKNNKSVIVRVNDRGPFVAGRTLDLSRGAAAQIGMIIDGVVKVRIEVLEWGEE